MSTPKHTHQPVMLQETLNWLDIKPDHWYLDATFGQGGHTAAILAAGGMVVGLDYDQQAVEFGSRKFAAEIENGQLKLVRANFETLTEMLSDLDITTTGILFDFGTNADQLLDNQRGLSFSQDGPLDMRLDNRLGVTAADLLAALTQDQLARLFAEYGGEPESKAIARQIVQARSDQQITHVQQLVNLIEKTKKRSTGHLHPATKVFQALRIVVNNELDSIEQALPQAIAALPTDGRLVTIAFHEGEDRLAKRTLKEAEQAGQGRNLLKKPATPSEAELAKNPRARSAKLRVFEKTT